MVEVEDKTNLENWWWAKQDLLLEAFSMKQSSSTKM